MGELLERVVPEIADRPEAAEQSVDLAGRAARPVPRRAVVAADAEHVLLHGEDAAGREIVPCALDERLTLRRLHARQHRADDGDVDGIAAIELDAARAE